VCHPSELAERAKQLKGPVVFTNGVFDLLHRGHVTYLDQAAQEGQSLIVAVNSDESVKRLGKGPDRPINTQVDRMHVLAALECVALVTYFEEDTPLNAILAARPDVLVKGGDWPVEKWWEPKKFKVGEAQRCLSRLNTSAAPPPRSRKYANFKAC